MRSCFLTPYNATVHVTATVLVSKKKCQLCFFFLWSKNTSHLQPSPNKSSPADKAVSTKCILCPLRGQSWGLHQVGKHLSLTLGLILGLLRTVPVNFLAVAASSGLLKMVKARKLILAEPVILITLPFLPFSAPVSPLFTLCALSLPKCWKHRFQKTSTV